MAKIPEEKRAYPRVKTNLRVNIPNNISANLLSPASPMEHSDSALPSARLPEPAPLAVQGLIMDLSESGLNLSASETIASPKISLQINFPESNFKFKADAKLVWKRDLEGSASLYGMEFVDLDEAQKAQLRQELIKTQINGLLNEIKIAEVKKQVADFFLKDMLEYTSEIIKLNLRMHKEKAYSPDLEEKLDHLQTQVLLKGYCLEELLSDRDIMQKVKDNFRQLVGVWAYKSAIVKHGFEKPRGYPGDYKMLEMLYDNKPISKNIAGKYFDNDFLKNPYAVAARIRKNHLKGLLEKYIQESKLNRINILSIACGSCREIRELLVELKPLSPILFTCLDQDEEALRFCDEALTKFAPKNIEFKFVEEDILNIAKDDALPQSLGKQNLIYSLGIMDNLSDAVLKKLISALYQLLAEGGKLILTHKNRDKTFPTVPPDWFCDWKFIPRNKDEAIHLFYACGISKFSLLVESDDFNYIYYFTLTKL